MAAETKITEATGEQLIESWSHLRHEAGSQCPGCKANLLVVAIVMLVYTFEVCSCGSPDYDHLVERLWHRDCFKASPR